MCLEYWTKLSLCLFVIVLDNCGLHLYWLDLWYCGHLSLKLVFCLKRLCELQYCELVCVFLCRVLNPKAIPTPKVLPVKYKTWTSTELYSDFISLEPALALSNYVHIHKFPWCFGCFGFVFIAEPSLSYPAYYRITSCQERSMNTIPFREKKSCVY